MLKKLLKKHDAVLVLTNHKTGKKRFIPGTNIVTDAGDVYYAQKACGQTPTNAFANLFLATAGPATPAKADDYSDFTVVAGSSKAVSSGFPKAPGDDSDNSSYNANDTVTWKFEYATSDGPFSTITHSFVAASGASGTDPILNSYKWASSWDKDASTSAKVFANHNMNGS